MYVPPPMRAALLVLSGDRVQVLKQVRIGVSIVLQEAPEPAGLPCGNRDGKLLLNGTQRADIQEAASGLPGQCQCQAYDDHKRGQDDGKQDTLSSQEGLSHRSHRCWHGHSALGRHPYWRERYRLLLCVGGNALGR
jgi:hypothetical protein